MLLCSILSFSPVDSASVPNKSSRIGSSRGWRRIHRDIRLQNNRVPGACHAFLPGRTRWSETAYADDVAALVSSASQGCTAGPSVIGFECRRMAFGAPTSVGLLNVLTAKDEVFRRSSWRRGRRTVSRRCLSRVTFSPMNSEPEAGIISPRQTSGAKARPRRNCWCCTKGLNRTMPLAQLSRAVERGNSDLANPER